MIVVQHTRFPGCIGNDILQNDDSFKGSVMHAKAQIIGLSDINGEKTLCKYSISDFKCKYHILLFSNYKRLTAQDALSYCTSEILIPVFALLACTA